MALSEFFEERVIIFETAEQTYSGLKKKYLMDLRKWAAVMIIIYCGLFVLIFYSGLENNFMNALYRLAGDLIACGFFWAGLVLTSRQNNPAWSAFLIGILFGAVSDLTLLLDMKTTTAVFRFISGSVLCLSVFNYIKKNRMAGPRTVVDLGITCLVAAVVFWFFVMRPVMEVSLESFEFLVLRFFVSMMNLSGMFAVLFFSNRRRYINFTILFLGLGFGFLAADGFCRIASTLWPSIIYIPLAQAGCLFLAMASLFPTVSKRSDRLEGVLFKRYKLLRAWEYFCLLLPDFMAFGLLALVGALGFSKILFGGAAGAMLLIWIRQFIVIRKNEHLIMRIQSNGLRIRRQNHALTQKNYMIAKDATVDFLTKLYNRRYVDKVLKMPKESDDGLVGIGLLLLDIDHFKEVNDQHGHPEGDKVLASVAAIIGSTIRGGDVAGRYGGDEFIVILYNTDTAGVTSLSDRLRRRMREDEYLAEFPVTISVGCTAWRGDAAEYDGSAILKTADLALYMSKESGRDRSTYLEPDGWPTVTPDTLD